jgi:Ni/Fe-hydrogenase subunit HybB-like protein
VNVAQRVETLPYGVGRLTGAWLLAAAAIAAVLGFGVYGYYLQYTEGDAVTGLRDIGTMGGATWGLYVAFVVYFVGVSFAGIILAALIRIMDLRRLEPVARIAEVLTVVALILGALSILADVGDPLRALVNLPKYARPGSPLFGTFTLVISGYLFASLVYLYLDGRRDAAVCARSPGPLQGFHRAWAAGYTDTPAERRRHRRASFWLAIAIVPLLFTAHSTLGFVFGLQIGRPGWHSALQAPGFVIMAGVSGTGLLIVVAGILRRVLGERERLDAGVFRWLNNLLLVLILAYLYFWIVETVSGIYQGNEEEVAVTKALFSGPYAWLFWSALALLVVAAGLLIAQYFRPRLGLAAGMASGILVNAAAIFKRYVLVVPSQTHGTLLPYSPGRYAPTWVEYAVVIGLFALGTLLFIGFAKVFPILAIPEGDTEGAR